MPCVNPEHDHPWPQPGGDEQQTFSIEECERKCGFNGCRGNSGVRGGAYINVTTLRNHVKKQHLDKDDSYRHITLTDNVMNEKTSDKSHLQDNIRRGSAYLIHLAQADNPAHPHSVRSLTGELMSLEAAEEAMDNTHRALHLHENDRQGFRQLMYLHIKRTTKLDAMIAARQINAAADLSNCAITFIEEHAPHLWSQSLNHRGHLSDEADLLDWRRQDKRDDTIVGPIGAVDGKMSVTDRKNWGRNDKGKEFTVEVERLESRLGWWIHGYFMALLDSLAGGKGFGFEGEEVSEEVVRNRILRAKARGRPWEL